MTVDSASVILASGFLLILLVGIAYHWRLATMIMFIALGPLTLVFHMTSWGEPLQSVTVAGVRPVDALLVAMLAAATYRAVGLALGRGQRFPTVLRWTAILLAAWIVLEIARNVATYGSSAAGEFRYRYLVLALPAYVALSFNRPEERRRLLEVVILSAAVLTLGLVPLIGILKGWGLGPESRFLPSAASLGLVLGWFALSLAVRSGVFRLSMTLVWVLALPLAGLVLVDGHRSVWLVTLAILLSLVLTREVGSVLTSGWVIPGTAVVGLIIVSVLLAGATPAPHLAARAKAFTDPNMDATASWRQTQWQAQIRVWRQSPLEGQGFGGYWSAGTAYGSSDVSPHNLYVQTLVKLGGVGLALLLAVAAAIAAVLTRELAELRRLGRRDELDYVLVLMGLVGLAAVLVYGVSYALDYYALLFVGLGLAAATACEDVTTCDPCL